MGREKGFCLIIEPSSRIHKNRFRRKFKEELPKKERKKRRKLRKYERIGGLYKLGLENIDSGRLKKIRDFKKETENFLGNVIYPETSESFYRLLNKRGVLIEIEDPKDELQGMIFKRGCKYYLRGEILYLLRVLSKDHNLSLEETVKYKNTFLK